MFNEEKYLKRATMFREWGRIGDNSEDVKTRFEYSIDGIPYDYKFLSQKNCKVRKVAKLQTLPMSM